MKSYGLSSLTPPPSRFSRKSIHCSAFGPGAWLALLPDGRFDGRRDALRYLCYTELGTFNSFTAEELEFHDPTAVK